jgi:Helix-turn-helix family
MEAVHGMIYFTSDGPEEYAKVGVTSNRTGYFASRAAAMGAVPAEVVIATFYNFHPGLVRRAMRDVWTVTTPPAMLDARLAAVDRSLRRAFDDEVLRSTDFATAVDVLRRAADVACFHVEGRPLFAGHASLPWPDEPHLALWHAQTLLREFRGDGHIAALTFEGLSGLDALVSHAASGDVPAEVLRLTRSWSEDEWAAGVASMAARGLVDETGAFTDAGRAQRDRIEAATDRLAAAPYAALGEETCALLRSVGRTLSGLVVAAGLMQVDLTRLDDSPA